MRTGEQVQETHGRALKTSDLTNEGMRCRWREEEEEHRWRGGDEVRQVWRERQAEEERQMRDIKHGDTGEQEVESHTRI